MKKSTKDKLLDAALEVMAERGYRGATTREIASRAGVCELTLFRHFGTKENLFRALLQKYSFTPKLIEILSASSDKPLKDVLKRIGTELYKTMQRKKPVMRVVLSEVVLRPEPVAFVLKEMIYQNISELERFLKSLKKQGLLKDVKLEVIARSFLGSIFSFFHTEEIVLGKSLSKKKIEDFIENLTEIFLKGVLNEGPEKKK
ncbi:MAG: TetR/AcrR family transcriptional regulator [Nitrospirae bacterium]|nr:MAG: TetR/AcrR family transcriptional regulator [Nitrospirota bacterium]